MHTEKGRTLIELLATLSIIALISIGVIKTYQFIMNQAKAQNTARMIKTLALERQNSAINYRSKNTVRVKGPHSEIIVENGVPGDHSKYFLIKTTLSDKDFCKAVKESSLIGADLIEVDNVINGNCGDNSTLAFYFKKNVFGDDTLTWVDGEGNVQKCPAGSSMCDSEGNATACEEGYYLSEGTCGRCGSHVATCEDEETPLTCVDGYELHWGSCIEPPQVCTTDLQCSACGECDTETGYCKGECEKPNHGCSGEGECGTNECMVCDINTHTCQYACERKEYLESTGTQYIDTGVKLTDNSKIEAIAQSTDASQSNNTLIGCGTTNASSDRVQVHFGGNAGTVSYRLDGSLSPYQTVGTNKFTSILDIKNKKAYYNGTEIISTFSGSICKTINVGIFNRILNGGVENFYSKAKLYTCKFYDNDSLVRDLIPVSSPKGNCMFDRVSQKLFCNANTEGPDFLTD